MVRTKEKKAKGDSAFTKQKQKVGRKKLAPVTATRAEVHARTLRLTTSTAMSAAMAAPQVADPLRHPPSSATTTAGQKAAAEEQRKRPVIAVQNFAELLSGTRHYKSAQRASAFATLTRLLTTQKEKETAAARGTHGGPSSAFDEYMRHAAAESAAAAAAVAAAASSSGKGTSSSSATSAAGGGLTGLTALEKLKAFAAALEAVTDTDDDVRRGALQSLEVLVDFQWVSPDREGATSATTAAAGGASLSAGSAAAATQDAAELFHGNALLLDVQSGHTREAEQVLAAEGSGSISSTQPGASSVSVDRVQAILQAVHVALTHALKPVRLAGVELLALLLRVAPPAMVRAAARAVCRHQTAYYYSSPTAVSGGLTMDGVQGTASRREATQADVKSATASALEAAQLRAASLVEEEEKWVLTLIRRVSTLVLRTKQIAVLPALLDVFLGQGGSGGGAAGESVVAALLRCCLHEQRGVGAASGAEGVSTAASTGAVWRHPELVNAFFDDIAPQWANSWKELMELRLELLRQEDKLAMASALARAFATVLVFLKRQQQQQQQQQAVSGISNANKTNFFSRNRMYYIKALFIEKMPVTMQELLMPTQGSSGASFAAPAVSARGMRARLELGLALVMVCVPLAGTDEGWYLMRDYFSIVLSLPRKPATDGDKTEDASATSATAAAPPAQPFRFPSIALLELSVRLYEQVLRLYPCTADHVRVSDDDNGDATSTGVWGVTPGTASAARAAGASSRRATKKAAAAALAGGASGGQQHTTVAIRLLSFFPALLNTVIKHVVPRTEAAEAAGGSGSGSSSSGMEDAALVRTLLCTADILERLAAFPDDLLRGRGGSSNSHHSSLDGSASSKKWEEGFSLIPRLLFALREQTSTTRPTSAKRPRENANEDGGSDDIDAAPAAASTVTRVGVLLSYPAVVDALVRRLLQVLWFLSSSGHPLLTSPGTSSTTPFAQLLRKSIVFLFGNPKAGLVGVLQRCATPTILLAHSSLYYLGAEEEEMTTNVVKGGGEGEQTAMEEAAAAWADVVAVMRAIRT